MSESSEVPVTIAARRLNLSRRRVYQLLHEGKLKSRRYSPRKTRVLAASINTYLADLNQEN